jgi:hypothetical protein
LRRNLKVEGLPVSVTGQCKELPTAISQGKTLEELEENIKDEVLFPQKIISKFIDS